MPEITIHEASDSAGNLVVTRLRAETGALSLVVAGRDLPLPEGALDAVMRRYGKPLAEELPEGSVVERLDLGEGRSVVRFRFLSRYDVIARDYLALYTPDAEPLAELAASVTAVLGHLARRLAAAE